MLKKASGCRGKVEWNAELEAEYNAVLEIMQKQLKSSPYDREKQLKLIIDGAKTIETEFLLVRHLTRVSCRKTETTAQLKLKLLI